tara:strand:- start:324 stop:497 length:174 start_codon:yes stop_codon:yes gene_type:complete
LHGRFDLFASRQTESERDTHKKKAFVSGSPERERRKKREKHVKSALPKDEAPNEIDG